VRIQVEVREFKKQHSHILGQDCQQPLRLFEVSELLSMGLRTTLRDWNHFFKNKQKIYFIVTGISETNAEP